MNTERRLFHPSGGCSRKDAKWAGKPVTVTGWQISKPVLLGQAPNGSPLFGFRWFAQVKELDRLVADFELLELKGSHQ